MPVYFIERKPQVKEEKHPDIPQGRIKQKVKPDEVPEVTPETTMEKLFKIAQKRIGVSPSQLENLVPDVDNGGQSDFLTRAKAIYPPKKV